jgi:tetratricopeptide (TPR) repeat protein/SAM-dependent methyltransferase
MIATAGGLEQGLAAHQQGDFDRAELIYRKAMVDQPSDPNPPHLLGVLLMQRGEPDKAVESIELAIELAGDVALFHSNYGAALRDADRGDEAVASFRRAIELDPSFAGGHYNLALALERLGRTDDAIASLQRAIDVESGFAAAYLNLGRILSAAGRLRESVDWLRRGIAVAPDVAELHYNLANTLGLLGDADEAIDAYHEAIRLKPDVADFHNNLGGVLKDRERWEEAADCFETAVGLLDSRTDCQSVLQSGESRFNLAGVRQSQGRTRESLNELRRAVELQPHNVDILVRLGRSLQQIGECEEAAGILERALSLQPAHAEACFAAADNEMSRGRHDLAKSRYENGLQLNPDNGKAWVAVGTIFFGDEDYQAAEDCFRSALVIDPNDAVACYNLGNVYKDQWRLDDALDHYDRAIELSPDFAEAHVNRGVVLKSHGRLDEAVDSHTHALQVRPGDAEARFHRSLAMLAMGDFERGWDEYESRWEYEATPRRFPQPAWDGSSLRDRKLLVFSEQGIGDEIMFASCLPEIAGRAAECVIECDPRLVPLFARSFPMAKAVAKRSVEFIPRETDPAISRCDLQIAIGSLPRYCRRSLADFPRQRRYLASDPALVAKWRERLAELTAGRINNPSYGTLNVGISWRGGNKPTIRKRRSTTLDQWQPLFDVPGVNFIRLQYGDCGQELSEIKEKLGVSIHDWDDVDPLRNLDGFAAQIAALDLVISIDNSTVHMAGALGVPVWTLLPFAPNWRWMLGRDDSPWYPTMRLFRQPGPLEWGPVFESAAVALGEIARHAATRMLSACGSLADSDAATAERRKYEHIWTHDAYRTLSPGLQNVDKVGLIEELRRRGCRTVLDAGCGSGKLMQRLMTEHAGEFDVHGFDISANCLDPFFDEIKDQVLSVGCLWNVDDLPGEYDAVLCTDVLEHIPTERVPAVLENLRRCTKKFAYLAVALFPDGFGPKLIGEPLHLTVQPPNWWFAKLGIAGFRIEGHAVERDKHGCDLWLHVFAGVS